MSILDEMTNSSVEFQTLLKMSSELNLNIDRIKDKSFLQAPQSPAKPKKPKASKA